jgi:GNAT superfamily N-acetyltransferase
MLSIVLPDVDYEDLASRILRDGPRMAERLTGASLCERDKSGMAFIWRTILYGSCDVRVSHPLGCAFLWDTNESGTFEVGSVWVHPRYRRNGYSKRIIAEATTLAPVDSKLFLITSEGSVMRAVMKLGFTPATQATFPEVESWALRIGLGDVNKRLPATALIAGKPDPIDKERWLFTKW